MTGANRRCVQTFLGLLVLALATTSCGGKHHRNAVGSRGHATLRSSGPLDGLRWPAPKLKPGTLLHDDGRDLWQVSLAGERKLLWRHPAIDVYELAASPDLRTIALTVIASGSPSPGTASAFLYELHKDGRVSKVDAIGHEGVLSSPIFLRAPSEQDSQGNPVGPVRLYWIRDFENADPTAKLPLKEVMVMVPRGPRRVTVALRPGEWPGAISGYPGSSIFTIEVFRQDDLPTRYEIVRSADYVHSADERVDRWVQTRTIVETDMPNGVAWLSPMAYVVPVAQRYYLGRYSLRRYQVGCEYYGSHVAYTGRTVDLGYGGGTPWPLLPAGSDAVLVLRRAALDRVRQHRTNSAGWTSLNVVTGRMREPGAAWTNGGWWTFVAAPMPTSIELPTSAQCRRLHLTYP